jgi:hypothetical protein
MEKMREEVLVEVYVKYRGVLYVRGLEYTVGEDCDSIEWHEVGSDGDWNLVKDVEFYKELENTYMAKIVNGK